MRTALSKEEVKRAVERSGEGRVPVMMAKWWGEGLRERYGNEIRELDHLYPDDVCMLWYQDPGHDVSYTSNPEYRFGHRHDYQDAERHLYFPLYKEFASYVHKKGMKFFLHSCGDNTLLMPDLIAAGVDVLHPIQKGCMDMKKTAENYKGKITFLAGMDVQNIICQGTPMEVREEVRFMKKTFDTGHGGLLLAMGNGIMGNTPLENIKAALDEMYNGEL